MTVRLHPSVVVPAEPSTVLFSAVRDPWEPSPAELAWLRRLEPLLREGFSRPELRERIPLPARTRFDTFIARLIEQGLLIVEHVTPVDVQDTGRTVVHEDRNAIWLATPRGWPSETLDEAAALLRFRSGTQDQVTTTRRPSLHGVVQGLLRYADAPGTTLTRVDVSSLDVTRHHFEPQDKRDLLTDAGLARVLDERVGLVAGVDEASPVQFPGRISRAVSFGRDLTVYAMASNIKAARMSAVRHVALFEIMKYSHHSAPIGISGFGSGSDVTSARRGALLDALSWLESAARCSDDTHGAVDTGFQPKFPRVSVRSHDSGEFSIFVVSINRIDVARVVDTDQARGRREASAFASLAARVASEIDNTATKTCLIRSDHEEGARHSPTIDELLSAVTRAGLTVRFLSPLDDEPDVDGCGGLHVVRAIVEA